MNKSESRDHALRTKEPITSYNPAVVLSTKRPHGACGTQQYPLSLTRNFWILNYSSFFGKDVDC